MKTVSKLNLLKCGAAPVVLGFALVAGASGALAQTASVTTPPSADTPQVADNAASASDTIVVTGSRIARPQTQASVPLSVVSATSIQDAAQTNLSDALKDLPITGQSLDRSSSNFFNNVAGIATVNLRNLGSSRTLVLINGRRSTGVPGGSAVDLNNIPVDLIDHVEIATGGASAVYGSDAIAGVVNIILKNNFTGLDLHAEGRITDRGDGGTQLYSVLAGKDFFDGKGHITANFTYTRDAALSSSARAYSAKDSPKGSAYTPAGTFFDAAGDAFTFDANNNVVPQTFSAAQRFNRASDRLLTTPVERYSGSILAHYDFSPAAELYLEGMYDKTYASTMVEPLAADDGGVQGESVYTFEGSPNFPGIPTAGNPFVPASIAAAAAGGNLDFYKRSNGIFDRSEHDNRDYWRGVIGLKGDLGGGFRYDASYEHSHVRDDSRSGAILMTNYGAALQATTNAAGQVVCADPVAAAAGCVPINIFGNQQYTQAQLNWLTTYTGAGVTIPGATPGEHVIQELLQKNTQDVATFTISGQPFQLPDGPLGFAAGGEYRREKVSEVFDPFTASGYSSAQLNGNEFGGYNVKEGYVELDAPVFGHHPGIYAVTLEGAARYADYSTIGGVWTYKYGGTYAPTPDLRFRAIYARAVRAPDLNELYSPKANTAQNIVDPCDQGQGLGGAALISLPAGCANIPGIANYVAAHGSFTYSLQQVQTIFGFTGGNPNLQPEATNTFTAGAVFTPRFIRNFYLTADYYTIKVKNAITSGIDPQTSVTQCFNTGNAGYCGFVHRNANGFVTEVDQLNANASSYLVSGIDVQAVYSFRPHWFNPVEKFSLDMYYNHKFKQQQTPFGGGQVSNELGTADLYGGQQLGTGFKDQFTFNADYDTGPITLHYRLKYLGPVSAFYGAAAIPISAYWYHDVQLKFDVQKIFEFYVGVNNLTDKQPPFIIGGESQFPGTNTVADTYDLLGRTLYAGVHFKF